MDRLIARLRVFRKLGSETSGSQLFEMALVLPMLLVFVLGIGDFGGAFNLKHRLSNAAREGARLAVSESNLDLTSGGSAPPSVVAVSQVVSNYLTNAGVTQCTIAASGTSAGSFSWKFSSSSSGCSNFALIVDRNYTSLKSNGATIIATHVTLTYPYTWRLPQIIGLLSKGSSLSLPSTVTSDSIMLNQ